MDYSNFKPNPVEVGFRIRQIRKKLGYSMSEFATKIDKKAKSGTVSNWETGKNLPNNERLKAIADLGEVTIDELLIGSLSEKIYSLLLISLAQFSNKLDRDNSDSKLLKEKPTELDELAQLVFFLVDKAERSVFKKYENIDFLDDKIKKEIQLEYKKAGDKKIEYACNLIEKEALSQNISPLETDKLTTLSISIIEQILSGQEYSNSGFLNFIVSNINHLIEYEALDYFFEKGNTDRKRDSISEELYDEVYRILEVSKKDIESLKEKYPNKN